MATKKKAAAASSNGATKLRQIPNIRRILGMRVINNPETFPKGNDLRVVSAACCSEAAFLATAFGPNYLDKEITLEQFLGAFQVGNIKPGRVANK